MSDLERQLRDAMRTAVADAQPPPSVMEAVRRRYRRRNIWLAGASVLALAILAAAVPVAGALRGGGGPPGPISRTSGVKPTEVGGARSPSPQASAPSVPSWARRLRGEVAYDCGGMCLMRPDGTGKRILSPLQDSGGIAAWSPDGRRLAFIGYYAPYAKGNSAIYVVGANGCHLAKLTGARNGTNPTWSPSGRQIAFALGGINVINANGTGQRRLLTSDQARSGRDRYYDYEPAWSATNRIAFVRASTGSSRREIYTMNADGSGVTPLTHGGVRPGPDQPSWSPDGKSIAFVTYSSNSLPLRSAGVIEVANADGTGVHRVSPSSWWSFSPTWAGGKIVFLVIKGFRASPYGEQFQQIQASAYIVNRDGTGLRLLYPNLGDTVQIAWGSAPLPRARCTRIHL